MWIVCWNTYFLGIFISQNVFITSIGFLKSSKTNTSRIVDYKHFCRINAGLGQWVLLISTAQILTWWVFHYLFVSTDFCFNELMVKTVIISGLLWQLVMNLKLCTCHLDSCMWEKCMGAIIEKRKSQIFNKNSWEANSIDMKKTSTTRLTSFAGWKICWEV